MARALAGSAAGPSLPGPAGARNFMALPRSFTVTFIVLNVDSVMRHTGALWLQQERGALGCR